MGNNFGKRYFKHIPFSFREKSKKLYRSIEKSPQNVVPQGGAEVFLPHD